MALLVWCITWKKPRLKRPLAFWTSYKDAWSGHLNILDSSCNCRVNTHLQKRRRAHCHKHVHAKGYSSSVKSMKLLMRTNVRLSTS
jgi:hypothetical protein